jgi:hypothetical protein
LADRFNFMVLGKTILLKTCSLQEENLVFLFQTHRSS